MRPDDLRVVFCIVDPTISEFYLDSNICEVFGVPKDQLDPAVSLPVDIVMQRLKAGEIKRHGPPVPPEPKNPSIEEGEVSPNL